MTFHRFAGAASIALSFACVLAAPSQAQTFAARDIARFPGAGSGALHISPNNDYVVTGHNHYIVDPIGQEIVGPAPGESDLVGFFSHAQSPDGLWQYRFAPPAPSGGTYLDYAVEVRRFDPATREAELVTTTLPRRVRGSTGAMGVTVSPGGEWLAYSARGSTIVTDHIAIAALENGLPVAEASLFAPPAGVPLPAPFVARFSADGSVAFILYGGTAAAEIPNLALTYAAWVAYSVELVDGQIVSQQLCEPILTNAKATIWLSDPAGSGVIGFSAAESRVDIHRFDPATGVLNWEKAILDPRLAGTAAAFSPDGSTLATCYSNQAHLWLWDRENLAFIHRDESTEFNAYFSRLAFSPDGSLLVGEDREGFGFLGVFFLDPPQGPATSTGWTSR
jgi:hypothetical protein